MSLVRPPDRRRARRGQVTALVAVTLPVLLGATAIVLDLGMTFLERRRAQTAADAAALAGATEMYRYYRSYSGSDGNGKANSSAEAVAKANGYTDYTINIPPKSGLFANQPSYIEVIVRSEQQRGFSAIWDSDPLSMSARAVARGAWVKPRGAIILLHPTDPGSLTTQGQSSNFVTAQGGEVVVNSGASDAITLNGGNATIAATGYYIHGKPGVNNPESLKAPDGVTPSQNINPGSPRMPDPFRFLPEPSPGSAQTAALIRKMQGNQVRPEWTQQAQPRINSLVASGRLTQAEADGFSSFYLLKPGTYDDRLSFTGSSTLVLFEQATNGGIFTLSKGMTSNSSYLMMDPDSSGGMMLYNAGTGNQNISLGGNTGKVWLVPPADGIYKNMVMFQARHTNLPEKDIPLISLSGGAQFDIAGSIYSQRGTLDLSGSAAGNKVGSQHVSSRLIVSGGANITVTYDSGLVANRRIITLVE